MGSGRHAPGQAGHCRLLSLQQLRMAQHCLGLRRSRRCRHRAAIQESTARSDLPEVAPEKRPSRGTAQRRRDASLLGAAPRRTFRLLIDLTISAKLPAVAIKCFGLERCVTFAHVWLHQRTGAPLINVHCEPLPGGRYRVVFHPRIEFPAGASLQEMAQAGWAQFEPVVRKNPAPWLWMYKHWRYRPLAANPAAYPFYANISEDFERRLDEGARNLPPMTSKAKLSSLEK